MLNCNQVYYSRSSSRSSNDNDACLVQTILRKDPRPSKKIKFCRQHYQWHHHKISQQHNNCSNVHKFTCDSGVGAFVAKRRRCRRERKEIPPTSFRWPPSPSPSTTTTRVNCLSLKFVLQSSLLIALAMLVLPTRSSEFSSTNIATHLAKSSGQYFISQLCAGKSTLPVTKRVEGAVLSSVADIDVNCTVTLRTRSAQQFFVIRFEELKLGCDDHLKLFDSDLDYGQSSIKDFSCKDSLASVPIIKTTGTFLTMHYSTDGKAKQDDGFRLVATAVFDSTWECPSEYSHCSNTLCISRSLFCDDVNHCLDNSDETGCKSLPGGANPGGSFELSVSNALVLLVILIVVIFTCVIIFMAVLYCWPRESHYAQYQHHLQRAIGVPLQTSSSLMFTNHQPQYHYFQPANLSPYVTPQHNAALVSTLPRGYSTLPLNLAAGRQAQVQQHYHQQQLQQQHQHQQQQKTTIVANKAAMANNIAAVGQQQQNNEYLMMTGLSGPPNATMQAIPTMQTNLFLPTSQSILAAGGIRYQAPPPTTTPQEPRRS